MTVGASSEPPLPGGGLASLLGAVVAVFGFLLPWASVDLSAPGTPGGPFVSFGSTDLAPWKHAGLLFGTIASFVTSLNAIVLQAPDRRRGHGLATTAAGGFLLLVTGASALTLGDVSIEAGVYASAAGAALVLIGGLLTLREARRLPRDAATPPPPPPVPT